MPEVVIIGEDGREHVFPDGFDPKRAAAIVRQQSAAPAAETSGLEKVAALVPMVGGAIGGLAGGVPGAAIGGAAGKGYRDLATQAGEIPGALMDVLRNLRTQPKATMAGAAQGMAQGVKDTGIEAGLQALYELGGKAVQKTLAGGAKAVYRGYLKPSLAKNAVGKADDIVDTALREGLPITRGGAGKAQRIIGELKAEVDRLVKNAQGSIDLKQIADRVRVFARQKYYKPGADLSDYNAALQVADRIDAHPSLGIPPGAKPTRVSVSVEKANEAKRAVQSSASGSYGTPNAAAAKTTTKQAGHELRTAVERATGGPTGTVAKLNARESQLIDAARAIRQAVAREANQNPLYGAKTLASLGAVGGGSYATGDDPLVALGKAATVRGFLSPGVQSRTAILAHRLAKQLGVSTASAARLAAYVMSEQDQQGSP